MLKIYTFKFAHIVLAKVAHVADDPDPNKHGAYTKEDTAHIVGSQDLQNEK